MFRIAFHMMGGDEWPVGRVYLRNLFHALRQIKEDKVKLCLLAPVGIQNVKGYASTVGADDVFLYDMPRVMTPLWLLNGTFKRILLRDVVMGRFLEERQINVLFSPAFVYKYSQVATLSWLPDFQHLHLPEMFCESDCLYRNKAFLNSAKIATRIILMSESVKKDFESFAPKLTYKVRVLHPITYIPQSVYESDPHSVLNLYNLPEKFVYLPNQFWRHKNHELVFQTVKILNDRGIKIFVVCTGNPADYRHPGYFANLYYKLSQWNIRDQVIYLGLIPHEHVLLLMRQSICVLNPSMFEGWGYTVDEARSVGKQVLLSDISAHREQNPPCATFFNPQDCNDLAEKLSQIWLSAEPGQDEKLEFEARRSQPDRLRNYAKAFLHVAKEAFEEVRNQGF